MLIFPDYSKSIINVIASVKKYYRIPTAVPTIQKLDTALNRQYKNVVLIILCGTGDNMLSALLNPSDILLRSSVDTLSSVYPSCSAVTDASSLSGLCPNQHGRLGQTMFFKEFCRTVELSTNIDPYSMQNVSVTNAADFILPVDNIFSEIADSIIGNVQPFSISMPGVKIPENKSHHKTAENTKRMFDLIRLISETNQNTFTYVRWNAVESAAVKFGCNSDEVRQNLRDINDTIKGLSKNLNDTLFIVTSNHGMTDISSEILINLMYDINDCLILPPSFCGRCANFFIKYDRRLDFEQAFSENLAEEFMLMPRNEIIKRELFGNGRSNPKIYDFIGDYCALAISDKSLRFRALNEKHRPLDKAACGGITSDEMNLPLCVIQTKQTNKWKRPFFENILPKSFDTHI